MKMTGQWEEQPVSIITHEQEWNLLRPNLNQMLDTVDMPSTNCATCHGNMDVKAHPKYSRVMLTKSQPE